MYPFNPGRVLDGGLVLKNIDDEITEKKKKMVKFNGGIVENGEKVVVQNNSSQCYCPSIEYRYIIR